MAGCKHCDVFFFHAVLLNPFEGRNANEFATRNGFRS